MRDYDHLPECPPQRWPDAVSDRDVEGWGGEDDDPEDDYEDEPEDEEDEE